MPQQLSFSDLIPDGKPKFDRERLRTLVAELASRGVYAGTSSWKYEGWLGQIYSSSRYEKKGKLSSKLFEQECLGEYGETFKTVGLDAAYYTFPTASSLTSLAEKVPSDFQFALKVTDEVTIKRFPVQPRFGRRGGQENANFLNADLFTSLFLAPCETIRPNIGVVMFEFSRFSEGQFTKEAFLAQLDAFLGRLPKGWPYGVELRNKNWLGPEYFACLAQHGVAHIFNSWEAMPPVGEQFALPGSITTPELVAARFLLKPGRKYEDAVREFSPYDKTKEINADARAAAVELVRQGKKAARRKTFIIINNRLEGNALQTIMAVLLESMD